MKNLIESIIHSGVALSTSKDNYPFNCKFDTFMKGFILVKRQKNWSWRRETAYNIAKSDIDYMIKDVETLFIESMKDTELIEVY